MKSKNDYDKYSVTFDELLYICKYKLGVRIKASKLYSYEHYTPSIGKKKLRCFQVRNYRFLLSCLRWHITVATSNPRI